MTTAAEAIAMLLAIIIIHIAPLAALRQFHGIAGAVPIDYRKVDHASYHTAGNERTQLRRELP